MASIADSWYEQLNAKEDINKSGGLVFIAIKLRRYNS